MWLLVAIVALAVAGCADARSTAGLRTGVTAPSGHAFGRALWSFYRYAGREPGVADVIDRAEGVVEAACMHRAGFFYRQPQQEYVGGPLIDGLSDLPGASPPSEASVLRIERSGGYGLYREYRSAPVPPPNDPNSRYVRSLPAARQAEYERALTGNPRAMVRVRFPDGSYDQTPAEGCIGGSEKTVFGSVAEDDFRYNAVADVQELAQQRVFKTPVVRAATSRWSACMRARSGRMFLTPGSVEGWLTHRYLLEGATRAVRRLEIHCSTVATGCSYTSGFAATYAKVTWSVVRSMPNRWYQAIVNCFRWDADALPRAHAILGRGG